MEPVVHYFIPVAFILALGKIDRRTVLRYSPLALLPDLDFFFGHAFLHSILMPIAISSIVYHLTGRNRTAWVLSSYFLFSHLILDLGFTALFYPFGGVLSLNFNLYTSPKVAENVWNLITGQGAFEKEFYTILKLRPNIKTYPIDAAGSAEVSPLFTQTGLMMILLLLLTLLFNRIADQGKR